MENDKKYFIKMDELRLYSKPTQLKENMFEKIVIEKINDKDLNVSNRIRYHENQNFKIEGKLINITDLFVRGNYVFNFKMGSLPRIKDLSVYINKLGEFSFIFNIEDADFEMEHLTSSPTLIFVPSGLSPLKSKAECLDFNLKPCLNITDNEIIYLYKINDERVPRWRKRRPDEYGENNLSDEVINDEISVNKTDKITFAIDASKYINDVLDGDEVIFKIEIYNIKESKFEQITLIKKVFLSEINITEDVKKSYFVIEVDLLIDIPQLSSKDNFFNVKHLGMDESRFYLDVL